MASRLGLTAEINGRNAWRDRRNGEPAPNTGGWVTYFTPGVRASLSPKADLTVNMQIPIQEHLFDDQNEGVVVVGGLGFNLFR
ncbi:MAG: hypothetical protein HY304_03005 [candidate division Zixibacteria bacterium]|nr:hypothetical protein [candidate division Zixibacteria bacterium]